MKDDIKSQLWMLFFFLFSLAQGFLSKEKLGG